LRPGNWNANQSVQYVPAVLGIPRRFVARALPHHIALPKRLLPERAVLVNLWVNRDIGAAKFRPRLTSPNRSEPAFLVAITISRALSHHMVAHTCRA